MLNNEESEIEYIFADDSSMLFDIFKYFATNYLNDKVYSFSLQLPNLSAGSKQLQQISWKSTIQNVKELDTPVCEFIEFIWNEAIGDLQEIFDVDLKNLTIEQVSNQNKQTKKNCTKDFLDLKG